MVCPLQTQVYKIILRKTWFICNFREKRNYTSQNPRVSQECMWLALSPVNFYWQATTWVRFEGLYHVANYLLLGTTLDFSFIPGNNYLHSPIHLCFSPFSRLFYFKCLIKCFMVTSVWRLVSLVQDLILLIFWLWISVEALSRGNLLLDPDWPKKVHNLQLSR